MHHPAATSTLSLLFDGYGHEPRWIDRQETMVLRCTELVGFAERTYGSEAAAMWRKRTTATESWDE
jgi:hypothetical protein